MHTGMIRLPATAAGTAPDLADHQNIAGASHTWHPEHLLMMPGWVSDATPAASALLWLSACSSLVALSKKPPCGHFHPDSACVCGLCWMQVTASATVKGRSWIADHKTVDASWQRKVRLRIQHHLKFMHVISQRSRRTICCRVCSARHHDMACSALLCSASVGRKIIMLMLSLLQHACQYLA